MKGFEYLKMGKFRLIDATCRSNFVRRNPFMFREMRVDLHSTAITISHCSCFQFIVNEISRSKTKNCLRRLSGGGPLQPLTCHPTKLAAKCVHECSHFNCCCRAHCLHRYRTMESVSATTEGIVKNCRRINVVVVTGEVSLSTCTAFIR